MTLHALLQRQMKRAGVDAGDLPEPLRELLDRVSRTYQEADRDRYTLERSLQISSDEMRELYEDLRRTSASELACEKRKVEKSLAVLRGMLQATVRGILLVDESGGVIEYNRRFLELWELSAIPEDADFQALAAQMACRVRDPAELMHVVEHFAKHPGDRSTGDIVLIDGRVIERSSAPVLMSDGACVGRVWIFEDVTNARTLVADLANANAALEEAQEFLRRSNDELEQRVAERTRELEKKEEELRHAQKMEAVGRLAGGVAHDFNNMLSAITSYTELLLTDTSSAATRADLYEIKRAAERAARLTHQLLAFSRQQVLKPRIVDLNSVITEMRRMLERLIGENIALSAELEPELGRVRVDAGQIEQVILNLVLNARDAMPSGGVITLRTDNVKSATGDPEIALVCEDAGVGMDADTLTRIFEPFFTTKERGRGTGLGLATVHGIVEQSGGQIEVTSVPGAGSRFAIRLPRVLVDADPGVHESAFPLALRRSESVLLVEDEALVRRVARAILVKQGYTVIEASNGAEAVALCESRAPKIDALVTDVVMPGMNGPTLAARLRDAYPHAAVVYMSGYADGAVADMGALGPGSTFLAKPFSPSSLLRSLRDALEARRATAREVEIRAS